VDLAALLSRYLPAFLVVLLRAGVFFAFLPVLGSRTLPARFRLGLAAAVAFLLAPVVEVAPPRAALPALVFQEIALAAALGLAARFVFLGVEMAGQVASDAMGMSVATVLNPELGPSTEIARFQGILATLLFLAVDGHHDLVALFARSYEVAPPGAFRTAALLPRVLAVVRDMFVLAVRLSAPMVAGVLAANLLLAFVYRAVPQANVFLAGFPLLLFIGMLLLLLGAPAFLSAAGGQFQALRHAMAGVLAAARN